MATSSIKKNFVISGQKQVEMFVDAGLKHLPRTVLFVHQLQQDLSAAMMN